jgi:hypothetical protein
MAESQPKDLAMEMATWMVEQDMPFTLLSPTGISVPHAIVKTHCKKNIRLIIFLAE